MDTAGSAAKNVKSKEFFYAATGAEFDVLAAVRDIMALFKVTYAGGWPEGAALNKLGGSSFLVAVAVSPAGAEVAVKVTVSSCDSDGNSQSQSACQTRPVPPAGGKNAGGEDVTGVARHLVRLTLLLLMRKITAKNPAPWGILRGVRPTKIAHRLLDQGESCHNIISRLVEDYGIEPAKAELVTGIAIHQRPMLARPGHLADGKKISIYIGIPYCPSRCLYCSFPAYVLPERREQLDAFLRAITKDIQSTAKLVAKYGLAVESIYVGGGTPTSLTATDLNNLLQLIKCAFWGAETKEWTVEAGRPDSVNDEKIDIFRHNGVNRVSINPQTMQNKTLKQIGRRHSVQDIIDIFGKIRRAAIPVINMDVIAGLPGETAADMDDTMRQIVALNPENITIHTLALKRGSILKESLNSGIINEQVLPNEETTQAMLQLATQYTASMDMHPYYLYRQKYMTGNFENVGYAKPGTDCIYNIQIMEERQTIIGIGPAAGTKAVSHQGVWRLQSCYNAKDVFAYIANLDNYLCERNTLLSRLYGDHKEDSLC